MWRSERNGGNGRKNEENRKYNETVWKQLIAERAKKIPAVKQEYAESIEAVRNQLDAALNNISLYGQVLPEYYHNNAEDIALILGLSVEKVRAIRKMSLQCISLQAPMTEQSDSATFEDLLMDQQAENPMKTYAKKILKQRLDEALAQLDGEVDCAVDGGTIPVSAMASTVVDAVGEKIKILRQGGLDLQKWL